MSPSKQSRTQLWQHITGNFRRGDRLKAKPCFLRFRSSKQTIIATVTLGIYVDIFLYGSTVIVLPFVLEEQVNVAPNDIGKITGYSMLAYGIASFISSPIAGLLADKAQNRREPLLLGLVFLFAGCIFLWAARSVPALLFGRILQGISAGFVWSIGLALIVDTVGFDEVGEVLAYADISLCFGLASSPPIAGCVLQKFGKNAVYGLVMAMILIDVFMRLFIIERKTAERLKAGSNSPSSGATEPDKAVLHTLEQPKLPDGSDITAVESKEEEKSYLEYAMILIRSWRLCGALVGTWASAHILQVPLFFFKSSTN
ncbi:major facilitator superfamily domain-containing protein [Mariannaea sp. PMI_226]|nr:major facilitator superfamily domain-containing protein [Mariannaea sp. PMI_226]